MTRLSKHYKEVLIFDLVDKDPFLKDPRTLPELKKLHIHLSLKNQNFKIKNFLLASITALELLSGQKVKLHFSKKNVAHWRLREGEITAVSVTLRQEQMFYFFDYLTIIILPHLRSVNKTEKTLFDNQGNFTINVKNLLIFPQIEREYQNFQQNIEIEINKKSYLPLTFTFVTNNSSCFNYFNEKSKLLFSGFQVLF